MAYEFLKHRGQLAVHTSILELHSAEVDGEGVCAHHLLQPRDQHRPAPGRRPVRDEQAMVAPGRRAEQRGRCISAESVRDQPFPREQALLVLRTIARERDGDDPMSKRHSHRDYLSGSVRYSTADSAGRRHPSALNGSMTPGPP